MLNENVERKHFLPGIFFSTSRNFSPSLWSKLTFSPWKMNVWKAWSVLGGDKKSASKCLRNFSTISLSFFTFNLFFLHPFLITSSSLSLYPFFMTSFRTSWTFFLFFLLPGRKTYVCILCALRSIFCHYDFALLSSHLIIIVKQVYKEMEKNDKWKKSQFSTDSFAKRTERPKTLTPTDERMEASQASSRSPSLSRAFQWRWRWLYGMLWEKMFPGKFCGCCAMSADSISSPQQNFLFLPPRVQRFFTTQSYSNKSKFFQGIRTHSKNEKWLTYPSLSLCGEVFRDEKFADLGEKCLGMKFFFSLFCRLSQD